MYIAVMYIAVRECLNTVRICALSFTRSFTAVVAQSDQPEGYTITQDTHVHFVWLL